MTEDNQPNERDRHAEERTRTRDLRRALSFGVIMATIQMGILLFLMYC